MPFYRQFLQLELERRSAKNTRYSLRGFAAALGVDASLLSKVLKGKERLGKKSALKILDGLGATADQRRLFLKSLIDADLDSATKIAVAEAAHSLSALEHDTFAAISEWYHYAILELTFLPGFDSTPKAIASALGISVMEARFAVERLVRLKLLRVVDGRLEKTCDTVTTKDRTRTSAALRRYGKEILKKAAVSVDQCPIERRCHFGLTMPADQTKLPIARQMIEEFSQRVCEVLGAGSVAEVYHLQVALFPLTAGRPD